jgi:adenylate cyclase
MFCDVRGFTAMSERLGAEKIVATMNQIFQCIEDQVRVHLGEILKFIGDALLIVFPREDCDHDKELGAKMIECALNAIRTVEDLGREINLPLSVGFGCHIGEVLYGNIGTETRLDFTVMGPAVNLTSRLESMCKSLGAQLTVSTLVAEGNQEKLTSFGFHKMKGIKEEVEVWGIPVNAQTSQ